MNREKAQSVLSLYGSGATWTRIRFARCDRATVERIEKLSDTDLLSEIQSNLYMIDVVQCSSLMDLQELDLLFLESEERGEEFGNQVQNFIDSIPQLKEQFDLSIKQ